jgi:tetratricopeptide (TPR) repeat protein
MKNPFLIILVLFTFASCSSRQNSKSYYVKDLEWDAFSEETYTSWGQHRLESEPQIPIVQCYQGKINEALDVLKQNYTQQEKEPYYWLHVGNCYLLDKKYDKAEFYLRVALAKSKNKKLEAMILNNLGLLFFQWGQWEKGRSYLKQSISQWPKFKVPKYNLARLYLQFGLYDLAISLLKDPVFRHSRDVDLIHALANAHLFKGDMEQARNYFRMLPSESLRRNDIAGSYALFLMKEGELNKANEVLQNRTISSTDKSSQVVGSIHDFVNKKIEEGDNGVNK